MVYMLRIRMSALWVRHGSHFKMRFQVESELLTICPTIKSHLIQMSSIAVL